MPGLMGNDIALRPIAPAVDTARSTGGTRSSWSVLTETGMYRSPADAPDADGQHRNQHSTGSLSGTPHSGVPFAAPSSSPGRQAT